MGAYLLKRVLLIIPTLFGIMVVNFVVTRGGGSTFRGSALTDKHGRAAHYCPLAPPAGAPPPAGGRRPISGPIARGCSSWPSWFSRGA